MEEDVTYSGSITSRGGFSFTDGKLFDESDTFTVDGDSIQFELLLTQATEKEIRFTLADDNAEVVFEILKDNLPPAPGTIFIGSAMEPFDGGDLVLDLTDARFNLGQPILRRETHDGIFIWDMPPDHPEVITLTKKFHVEPCTWERTCICWAGR